MRTITDQDLLEAMESIEEAIGNLGKVAAHLDERITMLEEARHRQNRETERVFKLGFDEKLSALKLVEDKVV